MAIPNDRPMEECLRAAIEGPLEAAFEAAIRANARYDQFVLTPDINENQTPLASAITIEDEGTLAALIENSQCETAPSIKALHRGDETLIVVEDQFETASTIPAIQSFADAVLFQASQFETASNVQSLPSGPEAISKESSPQPPPPTSSKALERRCDSGLQKKLTASRAAFDDTSSQEEWLAAQQRTSSRIKALQSSQRLRAMDEYVKPEDTSLVSWLKRAFQNWSAQKAVDFITLLFGANDARIIPHLDTLARIRYDTRFTEEAEQLHLKALALRQHHFGRGTESCALSLAGLARINHDRGRYAEAEKQLAEVVSLQTKQLRKVSFFQTTDKKKAKALEPVTADLINALNTLGQICTEQGKFEEADRHFETALATFRAYPFANSKRLEGIAQTIERNQKDNALKAGEGFEEPAPFAVPV